MRARAGLVLAAFSAALTLAPPAGADLADETALAERFAPVVRVVDQERECGYGERYGPVDVDVLFDEPTVALRGPWNASDLIAIGPSSDDLDNRFEYHLDFPGDALSPGCGYERWTRRITEGSGPAVYAHVVGDPGHPGKLALQYWFFYTFNEFNNLHEGDWEMIQLVFDAADARAALDEVPVLLGYSSHEGAESSEWDEDKLEIVDGTHPVVYPASGSHANKYTDALYLGSSAEAGVGCDDTRGPHREVRPDVETIPSDPAAARTAFPWIVFEGRWGELQPAFFNGPTGPNLKQQWTQPIEWSLGWRDRSYAVPTGGIFGTGATDFFCTAVATGSKGLIALLRDPATTLIALAVLLALTLWALTRTAWRPAAPLRLARRRRWGQILSAAGRMYVTRARLFVGLGLILIPLSLLVSVLHALLLGGFGLVGVDITGEAASLVLLAVVAVGTAITLLGFGLVQAATVRALVELDEQRPIGLRGAYALALDSIRPLLGALGIVIGVWVALSSTGVLLPVAVYLIVRWLLVVPVVELEERSALAGIRRSARLVRGRWLRVASLVGVGAVITLVAGPLLGALLILVTDAPLPLLNVVAGIVYAVALPFVALTTAYVYVDARARDELDGEEAPDVLPAEVKLTG
ncbi:MAG TPA: hypothetical protein VH968_04465 [Gaiellaceae bacterium]|jgi:hypothetical protein